MDDNETPDERSETGMFLVWVDTRDTNDNVVQFIRRIFLDETRARKYVHAVNREFPSSKLRNGYQNIVAWYEEVLFDQEFLDEYKIPVDIHLPRGMNRSSTRRMTPEEVQKIRELRDRRVPVNTIATLLDTSRQTVYQIINGHAHKAV